MELTPRMVLVGVAVLAAVIWMVFRARRNAARAVLARKAVAAGARLIDVRSPGEFASGHLPGAVNIPVQDLPRRLKDAGKKDRPVVVYCQSGSRSSSAAAFLQRSGYGEVIDLGPMRAW